MGREFVVIDLSVCVVLGESVETVSCVHMWLVVGGVYVTRV